MRASIPTLLLGLNAHAFAACTREQLIAVTTDLLAAQTAGQTNFSSLGSSVEYTENRKKIDMKAGVLSKALKVDHSRSQHDVPQCATFSEFIVTNAAAPYVIATQVRLDNTTNKVAKIDSIVTTKGDWLFSASSSLS